MRHLCVDRHSLLLIAHAMARHATPPTAMMLIDVIRLREFPSSIYLNVYALRSVYIRKYSLMRVTWQINIDCELVAEESSSHQCITQTAIQAL